MTKHDIFEIAWIVISILAWVKHQVELETHRKRILETMENHLQLQKQVIELQDKLIKILKNM